MNTRIVRIHVLCSEINAQITYYIIKEYENSILLLRGRHNGINILYRII